MMPKLILVNGLPCTGKSTLARMLAAHLGLPLFSKDQIKETLFDTLGWSDRPWSTRLSVASVAVLLDVVAAELAAGRSCVAESNFHPERDAERLRDLRARHPFELVQVLCVTEGSALVARYDERVSSGARHPGHLDHLLAGELREQLLRGRLEPLDLPGTLIEVDTTDVAAVNAAAIAEHLSLEP
ncbi:MAG: hypothetical protein RLZZ387_4198 [Chloroflexota bacterium]|jgi:predicted kinase